MAARDGTDGIMPPAEMKPLVNCAVTMDKNRMRNDSRPTHA